MFFFFKQKTAYEMRISDWSSDVCSSDLQFQPWPVRPLITFTIRKTTAIVAPVMSAKLRQGCGGLGSSRSSNSCIIAAVPLRQHHAASRCSTRNTHARLQDTHSTLRNDPDNNGYRVTPNANDTRLTVARRFDIHQPTITTNL